MVLGRSIELAFFTEQVEKLRLIFVRLAFSCYIKRNFGLKIKLDKISLYNSYVCSCGWGSGLETFQQDQVLQLLTFFVVLTFVS